MKDIIERRINLPWHDSAFRRAEQIGYQFLAFPFMWNPMRRPAPPR